MVKKEEHKVLENILSIFEDKERPHVIVALGKGGVGKTTISILLGIALEAAKNTVLIASLDPARHMQEYLGIDKVGVKKKIRDTLWAVQYDIETYSRKIGDEYITLLKRIIPGLTALGAENILKAVKNAPGFEEEVYLRILTGLFSIGDFDYIVIDTPPTGIALRVLVLPMLYQFWLEKMYQLRERIVSLRYAIARVLGEEARISDPVLDKLADLKEKYRELHSSLSNPSKTSIAIVATPEPLPVYEARMVVSKLRDMLKRTPTLIVANKVLGRGAHRLGVEEIEEKALYELEELRCNIGEKGVPLMIVEHAGFAPHNIDDVERLVTRNLIRIYKECLNNKISDFYK